MIIVFAHFGGKIASHYFTVLKGQGLSGFKKKIFQTLSKGRAHHPLKSLIGLVVLGRSKVTFMKTRKRLESIGVIWLQSL